MGPVLFIIYINDVDAELNNLICKSAADTKIGKPILTDGDRQASKKMCTRYRIDLRGERCRSIEKKNMKYDDEMCRSKLKSVQRAKDLSVEIASNLKSSHQYNAAAGKANRLSGFTKRNISFKI